LDLSRFFEAIFQSWKPSFLFKLLIVETETKS